MKTILVILLLSFALLLPLVPAGAQEAAEPAAPQSAPQGGGASVPQINLEGTVSTVRSLITKIVALLAPIGALFGQATGVRIGGSTGTGIAALVGAKLVQDKAPSWLKWILYLTGGTMLAGGGANITQAIMQNLLQ